MIQEMMASNDYFLVTGLAIILFTGLAFGKISKWLKIPNVTGYLLGGLMIGPGIISMIFPGSTGILTDGYIQSLKIFADIELAFIAFTIGTEFKIEYFKRLGAAPVVIAFTESFFAVIFIAVAMFLIGLTFGLPLYFAIAMGAVGGATAPAATILVMRQYKAKGVMSETLLSVVAIDDASGLIFFGIAVAILKLVMPGAPEVNIFFAILKPILEIGSSILFGAVLGFLTVLLMKWFTGRGNRTSVIVAMLLLSIGVARYLNYEFDFGFSSLMACMALGSIYTNFSKTVDSVVPLIERITPPLVIIFFVLSGADLKIESMTITAVIILAIYLVFRVAGKVFGTWIGAKWSNAPAVVKKYLGYGLLPQGGIALGLSLLMMEIMPVSADPSSPLFYFNGMTLRIVVIGAVFFSEIFGPLLLKWALFKSGEANAS